MAKEKDNPIVAIAGVVLGIFLVVTVLFLIFARESLELLIPLVWAFVVLGIVLGAFEAKGKKKK